MYNIHENTASSIRKIQNQMVIKWKNFKYHRARIKRHEKTKMRLLVFISKEIMIGRQRKLIASL